MNDHNLQVRPRLLNYEAAQRYLGDIGRSTLKTLVGRGEVHALRVSDRRTVFAVEDLDAYIERQRAKGAETCVA